MDGRERMTLSGSASYYLNKGGTYGPGSGDSGIPNGIFNQPSYNPFTKPNISVQSNVEGGVPMASTFKVENQSQNFSYGSSVSVPPSVSPGDQLKKKRGRPRKYGPNGANMSLGLSPVSSTPGSVTPESSTKTRGRPRGSGRKQRLAPLGEWMNNTAGQAFTPHILHVGVGEDVAAKILSFAQQRPRALCIMSASGVVSLVTLCQGTSEGTISYEGRFDILCLSGSYLVAETGGPRKRDGGLSISVCSPDGHCIGGAIGGKLIASSPVQVAVCSFVYGTKSATDNKTETSSKDEKSCTSKPNLKIEDKLVPTVTAIPTQNSATNAWPIIKREG